MKIAIPTKDGIHIAENLAKANGFLVFTIQFGEIMEEDFRSFTPDGVNSSDQYPSQALEDCSVIIIKDLNEQDERHLKMQWNEIVPTDKSIITRIIFDFLKTSLVKESNTLCCP